MELVFAGRFGAGTELFDQDIRDLEAVAQAGDSLTLYAATGRGGGLSAYALDQAGGAPDLLQTVLHQGAGAFTGNFTLAPAGGGLRLLQEGTADGGLSFYALQADGRLAAQGQAGLPGIWAPGLGPVAAAELADGQSALYAVTGGGGSGTGRLEAWRLDAGAAVTGETGTAGGDDAYRMEGAAALSVAQAGGAQVLLAAGCGGLRSYRIQEQSGALAAADALGAAEGLAVSGITAVESFEAYGRSWALIGAAGSGTLSLVELEADGSLRLADHLLDTLATRFGGLTALTTVTAGDHVLVLAAGADDGLALFRLLPSGRLLHVESIAHETGLGLENVTALEAVAAGDLLQVFAASGSGAGVSRFTLDLGALGAVREAAAGAAALAGSAGDDVLMGGSGAPDLAGGAGDDVLAAGAGGGRLSGGAGADIFLPDPAAERVAITDFEAGQDRLDLSLFPGLRSLAQLQLDSIEGGLRIRAGETEITVLSADGRALAAADLWPGGFAFPDRVEPVPVEPSQVRYGSGGADALQGGTAADWIAGLGGDDRLLGRGGADRLQGGDGADSLWGGAGHDRLEGDLGADRLAGGGGGDSLFGGSGEDRLLGRGGADRLWGGLDGDTLKGGAGTDRLYGGGGHDRLLGGTGEDVLNGGTGADRLLGQGGADLLRGMADQDTLAGGGGRDTLFGGSGGDRLSGGRGRDLLSGGADADVFVFRPGDGHDTVADFSAGQDRVDLTAFAGRLDGFAGLTLQAAEGGTLVRTGAGSLFLEEVLPGALGADDFLF
ncbi:calcium-binding protein (plasmid) [Roseobacteraceae bacterium NS-SX3]